MKTIDINLAASMILTFIAVALAITGILNRIGTSRRISSRYYPFIITVEVEKVMFFSK